MTGCWGLWVSLSEGGGRLVLKKRVLGCSTDMGKGCSAK